MGHWLLTVVSSIPIGAEFNLFARFDTELVTHVFVVFEPSSDPFTE